MKTLNSFSLPSDSKGRSCLCSIFLAAALICSVYFVGSSFIRKDYKESVGTKMFNAEIIYQRITRWRDTGVIHVKESVKCKNHCRVFGSETLPRGIITETSNLEMRPLWSYSVKEARSKPSMSLLAIAVGIKQIEIVDQIVKKFPLSDFIVMLFHYDGVVDKWRDLPWSGQAIHVSAVNQTKWWFAKRFLHPDIVAEYKYIFLWDEDIGVENFNPLRYLSIVEKEGLEVSQPALDPAKSEVHHQITARKMDSEVHRRIYKFKGSGRCDGNSTSPPCVGWVEMMAPVFSRAAWRCVWYMIQNDLIHAWGLDMQLGYCAQGDRTKNVGVVDSEYVVHLGLPTLGIFNETETIFETQKVDNRVEVRRQSFIEMQIFRRRWTNAVMEDRCWVDPYRQITNQSSH